MKPAVKLTLYLTCVGSTLTTLVAAEPHGGAYRGPGNVVPPGNSSSGSGGAGTTGGGSTSPGPTAPDASGPTQPPASGAPPAGGFVAGGGAFGGIGNAPRGVMVGEDLSKWQFWWEFNKDAYLALKQSIHAPRLVAGSDEMFMGAARNLVGLISARPSAADIENRVMPVLHRALATSANRDITSACLIALAKIGRNHASFELIPAFVARLRSRDQEIRETAALALGISRMPKAVRVLRALATDSPRGRKWTDRARVDGRTRAFASYGLGLIAHANRDFELHRTIFETLESVLADTTIVDRNIKVAALNALGLVDVDGSTARGVRLRDAIVTLLVEFYDADTSRGRAVIRAHALPAIARLVGRTGDDATTRLKRKFAGELAAGARPSNLLSRSAVIALGQMARPGETSKEDARYSTALQRYFRTGRDAQARYFALVALAQIGGAANRTFLLRVLSQGRRTLERPWAALALGLVVHRQRAAGGEGDRTVSAAVHAAFRAARTPYARSAMAISLGLCGQVAAADDMLKLLASHSHQDEMSGYLCVGLGLMQHQKARPAIVDLLDNSIRRPHRLRMAAVALGKLGDRRLTRRLIAMLLEREANVAKMAAVASALAQIGDRESIDPLRVMLLDENLPDLSRAFAAVALGGIADQRPLPWNAAIAENMNYRAAVETLLLSGSGVLEIL